MNLRTKLLIIFIISIFSFSSWAMVEIGMDYGYDRQLYGDAWQNKMVSRTYSGHWVWYMFSTTALELNYSDTKNVHTQSANYVSSSGDQISITMEETVRSDVYGVGLRQMLVPRDWHVVPMISIGYAKQFVKSYTDTTYVVNGVKETFHEDDPSRRTDNISGAFILKIKITKRFSINGSVNTIFRAFEFNEAQYNLKYMAGFSWMF